MTYNVFNGTLNPTQSFIPFLFIAVCICQLLLTVRICINVYFSLCSTRQRLRFMWTSERSNSSHNSGLMSTPRFIVWLTLYWTICSICRRSAEMTTAINMSVFTSVSKMCRLLSVSCLYLVISTLICFFLSMFCVQQFDWSPRAGVVGVAIVACLPWGVSCRIREREGPMVSFHGCH